MTKPATLAALVLLGSMLAFTAGCGSPAAPTAGSSTATETVDPYAAIPTTGAHEQAALAAIPKALKTVEKSTTDTGNKPTDVGSSEPRLVTYVVTAQVGDESVLFEVRANGKAYALYRFPSGPDPKKLLWQPAAVSEGAVFAEAAGAKELAAVAAVTSIAKLAKPGTTPKVRISGYTFYWIGADGKPVMTPAGSPFNVMIDPAGNAGSWSM